MNKMISSLRMVTVLFWNMYHRKLESEMILTENLNI